MSNPFLSGFQGGLGTVMQLYDLKDRREHRKKESAWLDETRERQRQQWELQDRDRSNKEADQRAKDAILMDRSLGKWMTDGKVPPGLYDAANRFYSKSLNEGYGKNKMLDRIVPTEDGQGWMVNLKVEDELTGDKYDAPLTMNRSNDKNDPVRVFTPDDLAQWRREAQRYAASLPEEERNKIMSQIDEDVDLMLGDSTRRDNRIATERENAIYARDRKDALQDRNLDQSHDLDLEGIKHNNKLEITRLEQEGKNQRALLKAGAKGAGLSFNGIPYNLPSDKYNPQTSESAITRQINGKFANDEGNLMGVSPDNYAKLSLQNQFATAFERNYPGLLSTGQLVRASDQALDSVTFDPKEIEAQADEAWEAVSSGQNMRREGGVLNAVAEYVGGVKMIRLEDGRILSEMDFKQQFAKEYPSISQRKYAERFQAITTELAMKKIGKGRTPKAGDTDANPMTDRDYLKQARERQAQPRAPGIPIYDEQDKQVIQGESDLDEILGDTMAGQKAQQMSNFYDIASGRPIPVPASPKAPVDLAPRRRMTREELMRMSSH